MTTCWLSDSCNIEAFLQKAGRVTSLLFCSMIARVTNQSASSKLIADLLIYLFDGQVHPLAAPMETWLKDSRRFTTFITNSRDKIRKKIRTMQEQEHVQDLWLELETAYLLLRERSLSLVYERQLGGARCPDFEVSFTTSLTFMLEVTRLRTQAHTTPLPDISERIADTTCDKLGQLLPQRGNVLLVGVEGPCPTHGDLHAALVRVQKRAERNDAMFLQQKGFHDRADFFRQYQRLSEILVRGFQLQAGEPVVAWVNPQAKYPLPSKVRTVLHRSHTV